MRMSSSGRLGGFHLTALRHGGYIWLVRSVERCELFLSDRALIEQE